MCFEGCGVCTVTVALHVSVLCVALCVVGSGRVGLRVTLLMEGVMCAMSCDV